MCSPDLGSDPSVFLSKYLTVNGKPNAKIQVFGSPRTTVLNKRTVVSRTHSDPGVALYIVPSLSVSQERPPDDDSGGSRREGGTQTQGEGRE